MGVMPGAALRPLADHDAPVNRTSTTSRPSFGKGRPDSDVQKLYKGTSVSLPGSSAIRNT